MDRKVLLLPFVIVLLCTTAFSAITVTINSPSDGARYNNLPANIPRTVDINFSIVDNNADFNQMDVNIIYYKSSTTREAGGTCIICDANVTDWNYNPTTTASCVGATKGTFTCSYKWALPAQATMSDAKYIIDINAMDKDEHDTELICSDKNADIDLYIDNKIPTYGALQALVSNFGLVLAGIVLVTILALGAALKVDPKTVALVGVSSAVLVAIGSMVIGAIMAAF